MLIFVPVCAYVVVTNDYPFEKPTFYFIDKKMGVRSDPETGSYIDDVDWSAGIAIVDFLNIIKYQLYSGQGCVRNNDAVIPELAENYVDDQRALALSPSRALALSRAPALSRALSRALARALALSLSLSLSSSLFLSRALTPRRRSAR